MAGHPQLFEALEFSLIPAGAMLLASGLSLIRPPGERVYSALQHFAGGVVFAGVAAELLPMMRVAGHTTEMAIGFLVGVAAMLAIARLSGGESAAESDSLAPFLAAIGVDLLVDGLLVGIGFVAGAREGKLLALALTLEVITLGFSTSAALLMRGLGRSRALGVMLGLAAVVVAGAGLGAAGAGMLAGGAQVMVISFGAAALLYLVTEELLVEAHESPDNAWLTAQFFLGFLLVLVLDRG